MQKRVQKIFRFLPQGKKKRIVISLVSVLAAGLVVLLLVLPTGKLQLLQPKSTPSSIEDGSAGGDSQQNKAFLLQPHTMSTSASTSASTSTLTSINADISADFGSRQNKAYPIPSTFLGVGGNNIGLAVSQVGNYIPQANFRLTRLVSDIILSIFPTAASATNPSQQLWPKFDAQIVAAANAHLQPIITLAYSPTWLQPQNQNPPQPNYCPASNVDPSRTKPSYMVNGQDQGTQKWGQLAAQVVAHMDQKFPYVQPLYEIWNEPDGGSYMCTPTGDANALQDRLNDYTAIFASAAPQMKQQASRDGKYIKVGGPALSYPLQQELSMWLPALLNNPSTYPYFDFISYHRYLYGANFSSDSSSLVAHAQDPNLGVTAEYEQVARVVHAGRQPNAASTPIYIDEYNMNSCYPQICRNDFTYAPLNNTLYITDFLNAVIDKHSQYGSAPSLPTGLSFYAWNLPSQYICMFGVIDSQMDCAVNGTIQPYSQYFAYELFGGPNYLNMTNGGYVANAASANHAGLYVTGFYTNTNDNIVIVNTTGQDYPALNILAQNPGMSMSPQARVFTLQYTQHPSSPIALQQVNVIHATTGYAVPVHIPAYATVAISF